MNETIPKCRSNARPDLTGVRRAFSLVELVAVMVIMSVLAAGSVTVLGGVSRMRAGGLADEVGRRLDFARTHAMATGGYTGMQFDLAAQELTLITEPLEGGAVATVEDVTGDMAPTLHANRVFDGAEVTRLVQGIDDPDARAIWFDPDGMPRAGNAVGAFKLAGGVFTRDATVSVEAGGEAFEVRVRMVSGLVER